MTTDTARAKTDNNRRIAVAIALIAFLAIMAAVTLLYPYFSKVMKPIKLVPPVTHRLGFSIYSNLSLLSLYKTYYANATSNDLLVDDAWEPVQLPYVSYWNTPQAFPRMIIANNYSELTSYTIGLAQQYNFSSNDYIDYDSEDWALTPKTEQQQMVQYTQKACVAVHNAGYKFAFSPEIDVPGWYGLTQFSSINWTCVDFLDLQEQANSGNTSIMVQNVTYLTSVAKGANPNLVVFVQLDMAAGSQSLLESDIQALSQINGVNGVMIQDLCNSKSCNNTLTALVSYTKSIQSNTTSTSSTTSLTSSSIASTSTVHTTASTASTSVSASSSTSISTSTSSSSASTSTSTSTAAPSSSTKSTSTSSPSSTSTSASTSTSTSSSSTTSAGTSIASSSSTAPTTSTASTSIPTSTSTSSTSTSTSTSSSTSAPASTSTSTASTSTSIPSTSTSTTSPAPHTTSTTSSSTTSSTTSSSSTTATSTSTILPISTYNSTLSINSPVSSNSNIQVNLLSANTTINFSASSQVNAQLRISNVTSNIITNRIPQLPNNDILLAMDINGSTGSNAVVQANVITKYPCGLSRSIGVFSFDGISRRWTPISHTVNSALCTVSYNVTIDPTIGIFVRSQHIGTTTTASTTTIPSGGTGGGSTGGVSTVAGSGGSSKPVIVNTTIGYYIYNVTQLDTFNVTLNGKQVNVTENYITPTSAGVTINGNSSYTLKNGDTYFVAKSMNSSIYARLINISYLPIEQTITLYIFSNSTQSIESSVEQLNLSFTLYNISASRIEPDSLSNTVTIDNVTSSTLQAPLNYTKLVALRLNVNSITINSIHVSANYGCTNPSESVAPFSLQGNNWIPINPFAVNKSACTVSFTIPPNQTFAIMGILSSESTSSTSTISTSTAKSTTIPAIAAVTGPNRERPMLLSEFYLLIGIIVSAASATSIYAYARRFGLHLHFHMSRRNISAIIVIGLAGAVLMGAYWYSVISNPVQPALFNPVPGTTTIAPTTTIRQTYALSFQELGLPIGTKWYVQLGINETGPVKYGIVDTRLLHLNSTSNYINFSVPYGSYYYTIPEVPGYNLMYYRLRNQGYLNVSSLTYSRTPSGVFVKCTSNCNGSTQTVSFERYGLPANANWSVTMGNSTIYSNALIVNFTEPLGLHTYEIGQNGNYTAYPSSGAINLTRGSSIYGIGITFLK